MAKIKYCETCNLFEPIPSRKNMGICRYNSKIATYKFSDLVVNAKHEGCNHNDNIKIEKARGEKYENGN